MKNEDQWYERFGDALATEEGSTFFNTSGDDLQKVNDADPACVWTVVETDNENQYLIPGFRLVNKIGYVISEKPITQAEIDTKEWDEVLWFDANELGQTGPSMN